MSGIRITDSCLFCHQTSILDAYFPFGACVQCREKHKGKCRRCLGTGKLGVLWFKKACHQCSGTGRDAEADKC